MAQHFVLPRVKSAADLGRLTGSLTEVPVVMPALRRGRRDRPEHRRRMNRSLQVVILDKPIVVTMFLWSPCVPILSMLIIAEFLKVFTIVMSRMENKIENKKRGILYYYARLRNDFRKSGNDQNE